MGNANRYGRARRSAQQVECDTGNGARGSVGGAGERNAIDRKTGVDAVGGLVKCQVCAIRGDGQIAGHAAGLADQSETSAARIVKYACLHAIVLRVDVGGKLVEGVVRVIDRDGVARRAGCQHESAMGQRSGTALYGIGVVGRDSGQVIDYDSVDAGGGGGLGAGTDQGWFDEEVVSPAKDPVRSERAKTLSCRAFTALLKELSALACDARVICCCCQMRSVACSAKISWSTTAVTSMPTPELEVL